MRFFFCCCCCCTTKRYRWIFEKVPLPQRIKFFEERIPYFSGFGSPLTLLVLTTPHFIGTGVYMLIFPLFVIQAIESTPITHKAASKRQLSLLSSWGRQTDAPDNKMNETNAMKGSADERREHAKHKKEPLMRIKIFAFTEWLQYALIVFCSKYFCLVKFWLKGLQWVGKIIGL
ncbi:hypothetical protein RFI_10771 [Reticulomyxa filosa]|uniref:Uncharacterized protein n=1 Tax=Reticulomyxa filosa TaxID=46433 RepID=X6NLY5_RETFI|nr:hypothetical protein RFI_10771 [Reticulomyxa filosa]|eukprot:ETO26367.1 hypothetical protein RFI_10771 [Reticulomyxa filosa]